MIRTVLLLSTAFALGIAPYQCKSDDPARAREDTPGDALWHLCGRFAGRGNDEAARATLDDLIERYPSHRFATRAREERGAAHPCATVAAEGSGAHRTKPTAAASSAR